MVVIFGISLIMGGIIMAILAWVKLADNDIWGPIVCITGILITVLGVGVGAYVPPPPLCEVRKVPVDIDTYKYVLYEEGERKGFSTEVKPFLEKCSQIQRKQEWLKDHHEEILMEVK